MFDKLFGRSPIRSSDAVSSNRWVVLDTETTGLSLWRDRVISIAAVAVHLEPDLSSARIDLGDSFEAVIRQDNPKNAKDNILIHHIGLDAQFHGDDQADVLTAFARWAGDSPLFAYHAPFDKAMLASAYKKSSLPPLSNPWTDVQPLANWALRQTHMLGLDECMELFGLSCIARHQAAADTFLTAELLLKLLPAIRQTANSFGALQQLAQQNVTR